MQRKDGIFGTGWQIEGSRAARIRIRIQRAAQQSGTTSVSPEAPSGERLDRHALVPDQKIASAVRSALAPPPAEHASQQGTEAPTGIGSASAHAGEVVHDAAIAILIENGSNATALRLSALTRGAASLAEGPEHHWNEHRQNLGGHLRGQSQPAGNDPLSLAALTAEDDGRIDPHATALRSRLGPLRRGSRAAAENADDFILDRLRTLLFGASLEAAEDDGSHLGKDLGGLFPGKAVATAHLVLHGVAVFAVKVVEKAHGK